ncbi:MAG: hypothetical protein PHP32_05235 [Candidatus Izemoplasmatales bacterium]|nr:hypothetical protein [Candidatus Izemoplasmatales bacterium]
MPSTSKSNLVKAFWLAMDQRRFQDLIPFFHESAEIEWPSTKESFSRESYAFINQNYPGVWNTTLFRTIESEDHETIVSFVRIDSKESDLVFYATSLFEFQDLKIIHLTEFFSPEEEAPDWRKSIQK